MTSVAGTIPVVMGLLLLFSDYRRRQWLPAWRLYVVCPWLVLSGVLQLFCLPHSPSYGPFLRVLLGVVGLVMYTRNTVLVIRAKGAEMRRVIASNDPAELQRYIDRLTGVR